MLASTVAFDTMIEGRVQEITYRVTIELPTDSLYPGGTLYPGPDVFPGGDTPEGLSLAVTKLEIDASIDTDMPEGTRLEEGFSAVQGTFTLAGPVDPTDYSKTAAWLFGRYATPAADGSFSPLRRKDVLYAKVTIELGLFPEGSYGSPELLTKLVGLVEDYGRDSDGNVAFTVIDLRQQYRGSVDLPAVVTAEPFNAGLTNEFVVDRLLRHASDGAVSSWPAERSGCVLAVGFRSSLWPEVGSIVGSQPTPTYVPGAFGSALTGATAAGSYTTPTYTLAATIDGDDVFAEFWVTNVATASGGGVTVVDGITVGNSGVGGDSLSLSVSGTQIVLGINGGAAEFDVTISLDDAPHYLAFAAHWPVGSSTCTGNVYVDGTAHAFTKTSPTRSDAFDELGVGLPIATIEALQVTTEASPTINYPFTPGAVLDPSLNPLDVVPATSGDVWTVIQSLAASELAVAGFEGDTFYYRNRQTLRSSASVRTITSDTALNDLQESSSSAAIVNRAQVGWTPWTFADTATTLWSAAKAHKVPAKGTWSTTVSLPSLATQIDTDGAVLPDGSTDTSHTWFRASTTKAGLATAQGVTVAVEQVGGDQIKVTATNSKASNAWLVSSSDYVSDTPNLLGLPVVRVAGNAVTAGDEQTVDYQWPLAADGGAASSRFGEIVYQLTGNQWLQDEAAATTLAQDIVASGHYARPDLVNVDIDPDPRLQRCDRVRLVDSARTGVDEYALLFGSTITYEAPSEPGGQPTFSQTIDARTITAPEGWLLGVTGRSELADTTNLP